MSNKEFVRTWHLWQHTILPTSAFRSGKISDPAYTIECELDHVASRVHSLGSGFISQEKWDFPKLAKEEITELEKISADIERCAISSEEKSRYAKYLALSRSVLEELSQNNRPNQ